MAEIRHPKETGTEKPKSPTRKSRTPINGYRNVLSVEGKDPEYEYRIVKDSPLKPTRIQDFIDRDWELVEEDVKIGDKKVGTPSPDGSKRKVHLGGGEWGYVMRIRKEWYDEDQRAKEENLKEIERSLSNRIKQDGGYGDLKIGKELS